MSLNSNANKKRTQTLKWIFFALLAVVFFSDFLVERHHAEFSWDSVPGFSALYGFISCAAIIILSKIVGHAWLMKKEDYYD